VNEGSDPGQPIAYQALAPGTPVYDREGERVGTVREVLMVEEEDVFDGIVIETDSGTRFIDAPEVGHIAEHRVDLKLSGADVAQRPHHEESAASYDARVPSGRLQDLWRRFTLRRLWRRD
jgi:sporulation protein YlmC with PRC-barrel domain